jgi:tRNA(Ile)-lysidine synthase
LRALHTVSQQVGLILSVAHLDHGVRGEAARLDAAFVNELARSLGLPFDLGHWQPVRSAHFEADARSARYSWLSQVARERGASAVAVGHTRDDQAETILHRLIRGTGPRGLAGMPARRSLAEGLTLVRPLLNISRQDLRIYLQALAQPFRDDHSNADLSRTRARLRHDLLPKLEADYNPRIIEAIERLGNLTRSTNRALERQLREIERKATVWSRDESIGLNREVLRELPAFPRAEVLRLAWRHAGWPEGAMDARRWRKLAGFSRMSQGKRSVGLGVEAEIRDSWLVLTRRESRTEIGPSEPRALSIPGAIPWEGGRVVVTDRPDSSSDETIDLDTLAPPLSVRSPRPGDHFEPLGMDRRSMPLNDFFRGRSVAREARARSPLVCDQRGIVWVVGHRIAHRVRVTESTVRRLGLSWLESPEQASGCD